MSRLLGAGSPGWLLAVRLSRVGVCMIYIAYPATLPVLQREWQRSGTAITEAVAPAYRGSAAAPVSAR